MLKFNKYLIVQSQSLIYLSQRCAIHVHPLTKSLDFISSEKVSKFNGLQVVDPNITKKPLTLMYSWILAKDRHVLKYSKFYTDRGINVLKIRVTPLDLLRPTKGSQVIAGRVLQFLEKNPSFNPLLFHGFSVGAYAFGESVAKAEDNIDTYGPVLGRIVGQIYDSPVEVYGLPNGVSRAMTNNKFLQNIIENYLNWYLKIRYNSATRHYERASKMVHSNPLNTPGLFLYSEADPVSVPQMSLNVMGKWQQKGIPVFSKCFEKSYHVSHFITYKREYEEALLSFLDRVGMNQKPLEEGKLTKIQ